MGSAALILFWCAAVRRPQAWYARCSGALVWASLSAATPAGAGGWGRWGARCAGPAASPPTASRSLLGEGAAPPRLQGGRRVAPVAPKLGGGTGGGVWGGRPPRPPAPSGVGLPSVVSGVPPRGILVPWGLPGGRGRWARSGRLPMGQCGGGGGGGGNPPALVRAPGFPGPASERGRSVCAVLGTAGPPSASSRQGVRASASAVVSTHPGCSSLFRGGAGPPFLQSASVRSWA